MSGQRTMSQAAPFPDALAYLVSVLEYRPGWKFELTDHDRGQGSQGLTLIITTLGYNSYHPGRGETYRVHHYMPVHDSPGSEHFVKPYAPSHGPGNDPYLIREIGTGLDQRTSFRGGVNP